MNRGREKEPLVGNQTALRFGSQMTSTAATAGGEMTRVRDRFRLKRIDSRGFSHFGWKNSLGAATADGKRLKLPIKTRKAPDPLEKLSASASFNIRQWTTTCHISETAITA